MFIGAALIGGIFIAAAVAGTAAAHVVRTLHGWWRE